MRKEDEEGRRREVLILDKQCNNMKNAHCQVDAKILQDRNLDNKKIIRN